MNELFSPWQKNYDKGVRIHLSYPNCTLPQFFDEKVQQFGEIPFIDFAGFRFTYYDTKQIVDHLTAGLQQAGVRPGERIGLLLPNSAQFVFVYYAALQAGAVLVPLSVAYTAIELERQILETQVSLLVAWEDKESICIGCKQKNLIRDYYLTNTGDLEKFSGRNDLPENNQLKTHSLLNLYFSGDDLPVWPQVSPDDAAVLQFSGGTTGTIKAGVASHHNILANTLQFREWLTNLEDGKERFLTAIPLSHVYGMVIGLNVGMAMGATIYLVENPRDTKVVLKTIEKEKITFYPGVPSMYFAINQYDDVRAGRYDLHSIKACISGSAPLSHEIREEFERFTGGKLVEGYGLTEAPTATHCNPILGENRDGSIGLPLPDVECRILSLPDLPEGCGELLLRGPQVINEYYQNPSESAGLFFEGWLRTGDIARMDKDGYFYLFGRNKELIKVGGFQVWPREVEEVLAQMPQIKEAVVTGINDLAKGELVKAWIILNSGKSISIEEIKQFCSNKLAHYKIPRVYELISEIPRTPVGKVLRRELQMRK